jgi:NAD(P)H-flavin reductase
MTLMVAQKLGDPDATDQKGNLYYRRRLLKREFLLSNLMRLTFELPPGTSLHSLGFDIGLGDFVRIKPFAEEHRKLVENPDGGRAYSPVLLPDLEGECGFIIKPYGPGGVSSLLQQIPLGSEVLITSNVEHVFWKERARGYFANTRNMASGSQASYTVALVAYGIGITEIAPVALSELKDPRVKQVRILWATKTWSDVEWVWDDSEEHQDLIHHFFRQQQQGFYGTRLQLTHILSQEERSGCLHGRVSANVLRQVYLDDQVPRDDLRFLAVGTTTMIDFTYETLSELGLDASRSTGSWSGGNLLYGKLPEASAASGRQPSPLLESLRKADMMHGYPETPLQAPASSEMLAETPEMPPLPPASQNMQGPNSDKRQSKRQLVTAEGSPNKKQRLQDAECHEHLD